MPGMRKTLRRQRPFTWADAAAPCAETCSSAAARPGSTWGFRDLALLQSQLPERAGLIGIALAGR